MKKLADAEQDGKAKKLPQAVGPKERPSKQEGHLSPSTKKVLAHLQTCGKITGRELAEKTETAFNSVSDRIKDLKEAGYYIRRTTAPHSNGKGGVEASFQLVSRKPKEDAKKDNAELVLRALRQGEAPVRTLSIRSGVGRDAVHRAISKLESAGYVITSRRRSLGQNCGTTVVYMLEDEGARD